MWLLLKNMPFPRSTCMNSCVCMFMRPPRRGPYLASNHQLHQASSWAEEGHGVLVGQPNQWLTIDHEELVACCQPAVPAETQREHGAAGWCFPSTGLRWHAVAWTTCDLADAKLAFIGAVPFAQEKWLGKVPPGNHRDNQSHFTLFAGLRPLKLSRCPTEDDQGAAVSPSSPLPRSRARAGSKNPRVPNPHSPTANHMGKSHFPKTDLGKKPHKPLGSLSYTPSPSKHLSCVYFGLKMLKVASVIHQKDKFLS